MQPNYHAKLLSQLTQTLGSAPNITPQLGNLLHLVSEAYTEQEVLEQQLRSEVNLRTEQLIGSTSRAYSFLDSLRMGFIMCDVNGGVVLANDVIRQLIAGVVPTDAYLTLTALDGIFRPTLELQKLVVRCLESGLPVEAEAVNVAERILQLSVAPMTSEADGVKQQLGAVILVEDITEQKVLERSKEEFLSIASHELRTPLTAIRGNAALIQKHFNDRLSPEEVLDMVGEIHSSTIRLIEIVNDFLDASALEQGKMTIEPAEFNLSEVIDEVSHELANLCAAKGLQLLIEPSTQNMQVFADRQRVKQVLINLVGNAVKFTDSGSITIATTADDKLLSVFVTDTGRGMSADSQHLLFRKFQQAGSSLLTRDTTKGTGLGLYISKQIVEQSGGKIWLEQSAPEKGSTFAFSLPITEVPKVSVAS
jgi:signal transduction histidine kinase